jgi:multidrug efflux system membrane fusion protein
MGVRLIDPGNVVHASDSALIATLTVTKPSAVIFTLSARFLGDVRDAMARGPVEITAFSQDKRHTLGKGKLLLIENHLCRSRTWTAEVLGWPSKKNGTVT